MPDIKLNLKELPWDMEKTELFCCNSYVATFTKGSKKKRFLLDPGPHWFVITRGLRQKSILKRLHNIGVSPKDLTCILLTHTHPDHAFSVSDIYRKLNGFNVYEEPLLDKKLDVRFFQTKTIINKILDKTKSFFPVFAHENEGPKHLTDFYLEDFKAAARDIAEMRFGYGEVYLDYQIERCSEWAKVAEDPKFWLDGVEACKKKKKELHERIKKIEKEQIKLAKEFAEFNVPYLSNGAQAMREFFQANPLHVREATRQLKEGAGDLVNYTERDRKWIEDFKDSLRDFPVDVHGEISDESLFEIVKRRYSAFERDIKSHELAIVIATLSKAINYVSIEKIKAFFEAQKVSDYCEVFDSTKTHCPGHLCYRIGDHVFTGDLFATKHHFYRLRPFGPPRQVKVDIENNPENGKKVIKNLRTYLNSLDGPITIVPGHVPKFEYDASKFEV